MDALNSAGHVTLNAEGKQYAASYQLQRGVITVTFGSTSRVIRVGAVVVPESMARTILRSMVREISHRAPWPHTSIERTWAASAVPNLGRIDEGGRSLT